MMFPWQRRLSLQLCPQVSTAASSDPEDPETLPLGGAGPSDEATPTGSAGPGELGVCLCVHTCVCGTSGQKVKGLMF